MQGVKGTGSSVERNKRWREANRATIAARKAVKRSLAPGRLLVTPALMKRFEDKYVPEPNSGCWLWVGASMDNGYGVFYVGHETLMLAHRASWTIRSGIPVPDGLLVCHHCDNPVCVNPDHLFLGTAKDNVIDCVAKGRSKLLRYDFMRPLQKLTLEDVADIRRVHPTRPSWKTVCQLASEYDVVPQTMYDAVTGASFPEDAIGRTFPGLALNRAVFQPGRVKLPEDE